MRASAAFVASTKGLYKLASLVFQFVWYCLSASLIAGLQIGRTSSSFPFSSSFSLAVSSLRMSLSNSRNMASNETSLKFSTSRLIHGWDIVHAQTNGRNVLADASGAPSLWRRQ
ncbi:hypothetical protein F5I97DRAFT_1915200 [Phlebopus sp. FC_14]|nr:hypothetical protein F5I97DRAFT_1915200 [Phlebopus sp. FC_14]